MTMMRKEEEDDDEEEEEEKEGDEDKDLTTQPLLVVRILAFAYFICFRAPESRTVGS